MKKSLKILLAILMVSLLVVAFAACNNSTCADGKHTYGVGKVTKEATCTSEGERVYTCTVCGETKTDVIPKLPHTLQTLEGKPATCGDTGLTSSFQCTVCGEIIPPQEAIPMLPYHTWDNGTVTVEPKCKDGEITFECTVCGAKRTEQLAARHNYDNGVLTVAPTCGERGVRTYTCKDCGKSYQTYVAPSADQHVFGPWVEETEEHVGYFQCQSCGKYFDADGNLLDSIEKYVHACQHKCSICDKCQDPYCEDPACADKCECIIDPEGALRATMEYPVNSDPSTNMLDTGNNAQTVGLNASVFNITSEKTNGGTNNVGLNKAGQMRLYKNETVTLTIAIQGNRKIAHIKVILDSGTKVNVDALKVVVGVHTVKGVINDTQTEGQYAINGTSVALSNTGSDQIWIKQIIITYVGESGEHVCQHVCEVCGKCTSDCEDPACADKCLGHEVEEHVCSKQCPVCGLCTDPDCGEQDCTPKCPGSHNEPGTYYTLQKPVEGTFAFAYYNTTSSLYFFGTGTQLDGSGGTQGYVSTTNVADQAAEFTLAKSGNGWTIQFGGKYLEAMSYSTSSGSTSYKLQLVTSPTSVWTWRPTEHIFSFTVGGQELYVGSYASSSYTTLSVSKISFITGSNATNLDKTQWPARLGTWVPTAHECQSVCPTCGKCTNKDCTDPACADKCQDFAPIKAPQAGTYYLGMECGDGKYHFITGSMSGYYMATTTDKASATEVELTQDGDGWLMHCSAGYIEIAISGTHINAVFKTTKTSGEHWTWDSTYNIFVWTHSGTKYFLGTYGSFTTVGGGDYTKNVANNYKAVLGTSCTVEPECQHTSLTKHDAVAADCATQKDGNEAYWECDECHQLFGDAQHQSPLSAIPTVKWAHSYGAEVLEVPAECEKDGFEAYYQCTVCSKKFVKDGSSYVEKSDEQLKIPQLGHDFEGQDWVQSDDGKHYKQCVRFETCGGKDGEEQCNTAAWKVTSTTHQAKCSVCGRLSGSPVEHSYDQPGNMCVCGAAQQAAKLGDDEYFADLASALEEALKRDGDQTITLLADNYGAGLRFTQHEGKITINLGTFTYTVNAAVGSVGTETQAIQVLSGATVEISGGTIAVASGSNVKRLINNYGELTLSGVTLNAANIAECDAAVVVYNDSLTLTGVTFVNVNSGAYALSITYWAERYPEGIIVLADETTDFGSENLGIEIDLATLGDESGIEIVMASFDKAQSEYTLEVKGAKCDQLTEVTFAQTAISHNYLKEDDSTHVCSICGDSGAHVWVYDATGTKNDDQHTEKCEGCGETKLVDHTYDQDGNKCVCGQQEAASGPIVFTFPGNGDADNTTNYKADQTFTVQNYTLTLKCTDGCAVYAGKENTIKLGKSGGGANFSIVINANGNTAVKKVKIYCLPFNTKNVTIKLNGTSYTINASGTTEDNAFEIDVSSTTTITVTTAKPSSGDYRAYINKIEFYL